MKKVILTILFLTSPMAISEPAPTKETKTDFEKYIENANRLAMNPNFISVSHCDVFTQVDQESNLAVQSELLKISRKLNYSHEEHLIALQLARKEITASINAFSFGYAYALHPNKSKEFILETKRRLTAQRDLRLYKTNNCSRFASENF